MKGRRRRGRAAPRTRRRCAACPTRGSLRASSLRRVQEGHGRSEAFGLRVPLDAAAQRAQPDAGPAHPVTAPTRPLATPHTIAPTCGCTLPGATRAGIEAAFGQGPRRCGLRRTRHHGLDKTRFQHMLTAAALNLIRTDARFTKVWLGPRGQGFPISTTHTPVPS
ncbi:transposase [Streptomyces sp. E11-3]|uniref:transposase n=1 Tax=Streptomyces sp. E11-3 TaxID=3110112 RepID=UPI003980DC71